MSETMTTVEIEDVLSSIRRLVSEDLRPTHKLVSAALQKGASKLILTPALRIVSDVRTALPEQSDGFADAEDLGTVLQNIEADEAEHSAEIIPVFGSVRSPDMGDRRLDDQDAGPHLGVTEANFLTTAMSRINVLSGNEDADRVAVAADTIKSVVAAVGAAVGPDEWEVDGGEPAPQVNAWDDAVWDNTEISDGNADQSQAEVPPTELTEITNDESRLRLVEPLVLVKQPEADVADPIAGTDVRLLGEDSIVFVSGSTTDQKSADAMPLPENADAIADPATNVQDDDADYLNEEILREIVRDMVRAELQGALGEKITHSVRKLVRAEINRALAAHDMGDLASRA